MLRIIVLVGGTLLLLSCSQEPPLSPPAGKATAGSVALDRAVLEVFYRATGGDHWYNNENWLSSKPLKDWIGVDTNAEGRVTSLWMTGNNLRGKIPLELGLLDQLETLGLSTNQLSGPIPASLANLDRLKWLLLSDNQLSGTIPAQLGNLDRLLFLEVENNNLSGTIPAALGQLTNLTKVSISGNRLTGCLPSAWRSLHDHNTDFEEAGLDFCGDSKDEAEPTSLSFTLTAQPATVREDAGLTSITITATLDGPPRRENVTVIVVIGETSTATRDVDYAALFNPLLTILAGSLSGSIEFAITPLADSLVEGSESIQLIGVIEGGSTVVEITLADSRAAPSQDGDRAALVALYHATGGNNWSRNDNWLSDAPISEWYGVHGRRAYVQGRLYEAPSPIVELALDNNNLRGTIPPELGQLVHLEKLYLSRNRLSGVIPPELGQLVNLRFLELHHNRLSGSIPPELGQLKNLIALWLGHNQLSGAIPPELGNLPNLAAANIIGNSFTGCLPSTWRDVSPGLGVAPYSLPFCGDSGGSSGAFNIELVYLDNGLSSAQKNLMAKAARRWEQVIIGDLPDISYRRYPYNEWDDFLQARIQVSDTVDDVRIFVRVRPMARQTTTGSPTAGIGFSFQIRASDSLPILSAVLLNSDLLDEMEDEGLLEKLMLHELGHCLGVGISWDHFGLLYNSSRQNHTADTYFAGFQARRAFDQLGGRSYQGRKVPVQQGGDDVHWRTSVFGDELMTLDWTWPYHAPLSRITVASLDDIGYEVNLDAADAYRVPSAAAAKPVADERRPGCQILHQPIHVVAEDGRIVDVLSP